MCQFLSALISKRVIRSKHPCFLLFVSYFFMYTSIRFLWPCNEFQVAYPILFCILTPFVFFNLFHHPYLFHYYNTHMYNSHIGYKYVWEEG
jgi:hypothetical protein